MRSAAGPALLPLVLAVALLAAEPNDGHAQASGGVGHASPQPPDAVGATLVEPRLVDPDIDQIRHDGQVVLAFTAGSPVNPSRSAGLAPTYLGSRSFHNTGSIRSDGAHLQMDGYTRGWDAGTCILAVIANAPAGASGCNQGGFWDPRYRSVYSGQDSAAAFFGINGIKPVARDAVVTEFGSRNLLNLAGQPQTVGTITLAVPLSPAAIGAINDSSGPMRVQVNNGFFGYALPKGFTEAGRSVAPASQDGRTVLVDNWTRAVEPGNGLPPDKPGGKATSPTFPYWTANGTAAGTGVLPDRTGQTNGSTPLPGYRVTIDGNSLAEALYGGFKISDDDVTQNARFLEMVGVNNKTGPVTWDEREPLGDQVNGLNVISHLIFGGCQNDDGAGMGVCGAMLMGSVGLKRIVVCDNQQTTAPEGPTDCVLDTKSTLGWKSTKTSGYVLWIDPGATGTPRMVTDWNGNVNTAGRIRVGGDHDGVTVDPGGSIVATGLVVPGQFLLAALPPCSNSVLGAHVFVTDGRKPGEAPGDGSGVPADCVPVARGGTPVWASSYDRAAVSR